MSLPHRRSASVIATLVGLLAAGLSGCSSERSGSDGEKPSAPAAAGTTAAKPAPPKPEGALGDILVAGRPVTGSEASGHAKVPWRRTYTDGELYSAVTGYRSMAFGAAGLEGLLQDEITAGKDVATTIDPALQRAAFDALRGRKGAAIALDARTGEIVALVSTPGYDPGTFSGYMTADDKAMKQLRASPDGPLSNKALRNVENIGSAAHVIVAATALEKGLLASVDTPTSSPAVFNVPDSTARFAGDPAHCTDASLRTALRHACSNVFARLAADLGGEALAATAGAFGFNWDTMDMPLRTWASTWPAKPGNPAQLALTADGLFDTKATPVHMAMVMAAVGNGGTRVQPQLVAAGVGPAPMPARRAVSRHTADELRSAIGDSVNAWVPSASVTWALASGSARGGRPLAVAVCLSTPTDTTQEAGGIAARLAGAAGR
ncbi:penicillin-binding transpeptidase domain-containing protein [Streptomyces sp. NPDC089799]|uniref:penicillin-binding transpeptidase domain-containing protein n=1 Tax=Streptomyces sp. NPDC089799 TaxID=3155066 RepID=UPI0034175C8C